MSFRPTRRRCEVEHDELGLVVAGELERALAVGRPVGIEATLAGARTGTRLKAGSSSTTRRQGVLSGSSYGLSRNQHARNRATTRSGNGIQDARHDARRRRAPASNRRPCLAHAPRAAPDAPPPRGPAATRARDPAPRQPPARPSRRIPSSTARAPALPRASLALAALSMRLCRASPSDASATMTACPSAASASMCKACPGAQTPPAPAHLRHPGPHLDRPPLSARCWPASRVSPLRMSRQ